MQNSNSKIKILIIKNIFIIFCILILSRVVYCGTRSHFLSFGPGVAAAGMAGTFTAIGNDVSVIYYNPAILGKLESNEVSANYWSLLEGTRYMFLGMSLKLTENTGFAISGTQLGTDGIEVRQSLEEKGRKESASQNVINLAYGGYVENIKLHYGIGIKYLYYDIVGYTASGGVVDFGFHKNIKKYKLSSLDAGLVFKNVINLPIKLKDESEDAPLITKAGIGFKTLLFPKYNKQKDEFRYDKLTLGLNFGSEDTEIIYSFGGEYMLHDLLLLRAGYNGNNVNLGFGIRCFGGFQFDYSYQFSKVDTINKMGFNYKWGNNDKLNYSKTQTVTDDFQNIYKKAGRIYENFVRDAKTLIEINKLDDAIMLLQRAVPLRPNDNEAFNLLQLAEKKRISKKVNEYLNKAQKFLNKKNFVSGYQATLQAVDVASTNDTKIFINENFGDKNIVTKITSIKKKEIEKYEKRINQLIEETNIEQAEKEIEKIELLDKDFVKKCKEKIVTAKEQIANKYLGFATNLEKEKKLVDAYIYYTRAEELIGEDGAIESKLKKIKRKLLRTKENTFEEKMYIEKLYYIAAIAFANNANNIKETFKDLQDFDPAFKWNKILEKYLFEIKILDRRIK